MSRNGRRNISLCASCANRTPFLLPISVSCARSPVWNDASIPYPNFLIELNGGGLGAPMPRNSETMYLEGGWAASNFRNGAPWPFPSGDISHQYNSAIAGPRANEHLGPLTSTCFLLTGGNDPTIGKSAQSSESRHTAVNAAFRQSRLNGPQSHSLRDLLVRTDRRRPRCRANYETQMKLSLTYRLSSPFVPLLQPQSTQLIALLFRLLSERSKPMAVLLISAAVIDILCH